MNHRHDSPATAPRRRALLRLASAAALATIALAAAPSRAQGAQTFDRFVSLAPRYGFPAAFTPDGGLMASRDLFSGVVHLVDMETKSYVRSFAAPKLRTPQFLELSPNGAWLAASSQDGILAAWDAATGDLVFFRDDATYATEFKLTDDGRLGAYFPEENRIRFWDVATGVESAPLEFGEEHAGGASLTGDLSKVLIRNVEIWDVATASLERTLDMTGAPGGYIVTGKITRDGTRALVSTGGFPGNPETGDPESAGVARLFSVADGSALRETPIGPYNSFVAVPSADGEMVLLIGTPFSAPSITSKVANLATGVTTDLNVANYASILPSGDSVPRFEPDKWQLESTATAQPVFEEEYQLTTVNRLGTGQVRMSRDGTKIVASRGAALAVYDLANGDSLSSGAGLASGALDLQLLPSGDATLTLVGQVRVERRAFDTGALIDSYQIVSPTSRFADLDLHPNGNNFVTAWSGGAALEWELGGMSPVRTLTHGDRVLTAIYSPDGDMVASASADGDVRLWASGETTPRFSLPQPHLSAPYMAFSPDSLLLATGDNEDGMLRGWDVATGALRWESLNASTRPSDNGISGFGELRFSADGRTILNLRADNDAPFEYWDSASGKGIADFVGYGFLLGLSPDGTLAYSFDNAGIYAWTAPYNLMDGARGIANSLLGIEALNPELQDLNGNDRVEAGDVVMAVNAGRR